MHLNITAPGNALGKIKEKEKNNHATRNFLFLLKTTQQLNDIWSTIGRKSFSQNFS